MNQVLFLCSRNVCSSRVAAALFNHLVKGGHLANGVRSPLPGWKAISRGIDLATPDGVALSENAVAYFDVQGILVDRNRQPKPVEPSDLLWSDRIISLHEAEHRPLVESQFSFWNSQIEYWDVPDFHESNWGRALPKLEANVSELISVIRASERVASI